MERKEEAPADHRSWQEQIYWSHFQILHFSQFLRTGFDRQLAIPETFTNNLKRKLPDTVTLKSPSGIEWEVGLTAKDNTLFFDHGWGEFVKDQYLKENDILVFKYNGESRFDVLPFNGLSMCEKVSSYFLRKCCCKGRENPCHYKRSSSGSSAEAVCTSPRDDGIGGSLQKDSTKKNVYTASNSQHIDSIYISKKLLRAMELDTPMNTTDCAINKEFSACSDEFETKPDIGNTAIIQSGINSITMEERRRVLHMAQAILSPVGFLAVMKPTHVAKKFSLSLPSYWVKRHFSFRKNHYVILRINENTWKGRLFCSKKPPYRGVLGGGWKKFVFDNNLREFDVCVFEPRGELNNTMVLDVYICRVG